MRDPYAERIFDETVALGKSLADRVVDETEVPTVGILALIMAATMLAKIVEWDESRLREAYEATIKDAYKPGKGKGPVLNA